MRPAWGELERSGRAAAVWQRAQQTFASKVIGPHFERICRDWARWHAAPETVGGAPDSLGSGTVTDRSGHATHEIDLGVLGRDSRDRPVVRCLGEAKWNNTTMTAGHVARLARIRDLLRGHPAARADEHTRLVLFSAAGFADGVREQAANSADLILVNLDRLYRRLTCRVPDGVRQPPGRETGPRLVVPASS